MFFLQHLQHQEYHRLFLEILIVVYAVEEKILLSFLIDVNHAVVELVPLNDDAACGGRVDVDEETEVQCCFCSKK